MKYCRFLHHGHIRYGTVDENNGDLWITALAPAPAEDMDYRLAVEQGHAGSFDNFVPLPLNDAELLPPVTPSKIVCVGRNYREHAQELGNEIPSNPVLFLKPPSSLLSPGGTVRLPAVSERVDYEGELALIISRRARNLPPDANWREFVRGFTLANDITARDLQNTDAQWFRAKGFDTFCPVGPIVSDELDLDGGLTIETHLNGELCQRGSSLDFIFPVPLLLSLITSVLTLEPGDLVLTGTPSGVGKLSHGDHVEVSMDGLGKLRNPVEAESS
jgi:2-keto-4-pentenoate hydratase/2-oxohepta-3-ene-1,7-dioic acid hydratase in catechol pathway